MPDRRAIFIVLGVFTGILFVWWIFSGSDEENSQTNLLQSTTINLCQQKNERSSELYVQNYLDRLRLNDIYTDIDVSYNGGVSRAHKIILAAQSQHLNKIMWNQSQNNETQRIDLSFLNGEITTAILNYLYGGTIEFDNFEFATSILKAADGLGLESLKCESSKYLSRMTSIKSVGSLLVIADQTNSPYLMTNATIFFFNNLDKVRNSIEWKAVTNEHKYIAANAFDYHGKLPKNGICNIECYPTTLRSPVIVDRLVDLFQKGRFADVEVSSGKNQSEYIFQVNKAVLVGQSPKFQEQIKQNATSIEILGFDKMAVREFILYMYSGKLEDLSKYLADMCSLAAIYEMYALRVACEEDIIENLAVSNAVDAVKIAYHLKSTKLSKSVSDFLLKHKQEIVKTPAWSDLKTNEPELLADIF